MDVEPTTSWKLYLLVASFRNSIATETNGILNRHAERMIKHGMGEEQAFGLLLKDVKSFEKAIEKFFNENIKPFDVNTV